MLPIIFARNNKESIKVTQTFDDMPKNARQSLSNSMKCLPDIAGG